MVIVKETNIVFFKNTSYLIFRNSYLKFFRFNVRNFIIIVVVVVIIILHLFRITPNKLFIAWQFTFLKLQLLLEECRALLQ